MVPAASPGNSSGNSSLTPPSRLSLSLLRAMAAASGSTTACNDGDATAVASWTRTASL
ncbi:uncharacterized protein DS421_3g80620 [Arachis hypogaea]|nr:uncharacterized protein DS421_3g80620 [Arachis hypogaea]